MTTRAERVRGGLRGLLIGDAVGVPYEFKDAGELGPRDAIGHRYPPGFRRAHASAPARAWSDDGAQALCLLESLRSQGRLDADDFVQRMVRWLERGHLAIERKVFDVGIQTSQVLRAIASGARWQDVVASDDPQTNGNGALMRVLPLALWHTGSDAELARDACLQSRVTHGHLRSQLCCALYCLWARGLLDAAPDAYERATETLYALADERERQELDLHLRPREEPEAHGSGYVVDTLHGARIAMREASYERVVQRAIAFGNDTDTTAAVAGGLAGIRDGDAAIPSAWRLHEDGERIVDELLRATGSG